MNPTDPVLNKILENIDFRLLREMEPGALYDSSKFDGEAYRALDVANTQFLDGPSPLMNLEFLRTPRLSTIAIGYIINRLVREMPSDLDYLNVGVWCGFSLLAGAIGNEQKRCVGVDNFSDRTDTRQVFNGQFSKFRTAKTEFFEKDYLDYFQSSHRNPIGVYFYDGDHSYENQLKGLEVGEPFLAPGAYILVDDTNDPAPRDATLAFMEKRSDQYRLVLDVKTANNGHPTFWNGLMILRKTEQPA